MTDYKRTHVAQEAMEFSRKNGVKTAISLSDPFVVQVFAQNMSQVIDSGVDLLFCNQDEALSYTNSTNLEDAIEGLKSIAKTFVITRWKWCNGFWWYSIARVPGVSTEAVGTNGAGHMFSGAFLYAINAGHSYVWAAKFANPASAWVVSQFGPRIESVEHDQIKQQFGI